MQKALPLVIVGSVVLLFIGIFLLSSKGNDQSPTNNPLSNVQLPTAAPTVMADFDKLEVEDTLVGTGAAVKSGDTIVINYLGSFVDGTKFDSSYDRNQPFTTQIGVGRVIPGWDQGVIGMQVGGKRRLKIPSSLAYGSQGAPPTIPGNTPLIFELELLEIK